MVLNVMKKFSTKDRTYKFSS